MVGAAGAADADEPVGEEGEVGPRDRGEQHGAVARCGGEGRSLLERVGAPRGGGDRGGAGGAPGEEEGCEEEEREEGEEVGDREEGERAGWGGGGGGDGEGVAGGRRPASGVAAGGATLPVAGDGGFRSGGAVVL